MLRMIGCLFAAASAVVGSSAAAADAYRIEPSHVDVLFSANHMGFSNTHGFFRKIDGTLSFDPDDVTRSQVDVTIDATSLDTKHALRDAHLKGADFFDVTNHPTIRLVSRKITQAGENALRLEGDLTLRGITRPVMLDFRINRIGINPFGKRPTIGVSASGSLKRSDFGMTGFTTSVSDEVKLTIDVEFTRVDPQQTP